MRPNTRVIAPQLLISGLTVGAFIVAALGMDRYARLSEPASPAQATSAPGTILGDYSGSVALLSVRQGSYEDIFKQTPTPGPTPTKWDLGNIDLGLRLAQTGNQVSGFVILDDTLVYPKMATVVATPLGLIPTPGESGPTPAVMDIGPSVAGAIDGQTLRLESSTMNHLLAEARTLADGRKIAKQEVTRKFMLVTDPALSNADRLIGLYFETLWGYDTQPSTVMGAFVLARDGAEPDVLLLTPSTPSPSNTPGGPTGVPTVSIKANCPEIIRLESPLIAARNVPSLNARSGSGGGTDRADQGDFRHDQGLA